MSKQSKHTSRIYSLTYLPKWGFHIFSLLRPPALLLPQDTYTHILSANDVNSYLTEKMKQLKRTTLSYLTKSATLPGSLPLHLCPRPHLLFYFSCICWSPGNQFLPLYWIVPINIYTFLIMSQWHLFLLTPHNLHQAYGPPLVSGVLFCSFAWQKIIEWLIYWPCHLFIPSKPSLLSPLPFPHDWFFLMGIITKVHHASKFTRHFYICSSYSNSWQD